MKKIISVVLMLLSVLVLSACQDSKTYDDSINVKFFSEVINGTNPIDISNLTSGDLLVKPENPTKESYVFDGWFRDFQITDEWNFATDTIGDKSIILFAKWIPAIFNVTFELYGGEFIGDDIPTLFSPGENIILPQARKTGFIFVGWYDYPWVDESSTIPGDSGYQILPSDYNQDLDLYAHWKTIEARISFDTNFPINDAGPDNREVGGLSEALLLDRAYRDVKFLSGKA